MKELSGRPETIKLLGKNIGESLHKTGLGNDSWLMTPKAQGNKSKIQTSGITSNDKASA